MNKNEENENSGFPKRGLLFDDELERSVVESIENEDFSSFRDIVLEKIVEADENAGNPGDDEEDGDPGDEKSEDSGSGGSPFGGNDPEPDNAGGDSEDAGHDGEDKGSDSPFGGDSKPDSDEDGGGEGESGENEKDETPEFQTLDELIRETGTSVSIEYEGTEPSPIFGPSDTKPRDKWKIYLKNENGSVWFTYWDQQTDQENRVPPGKDEIVRSIARACSEYGNSMSPDQFKSRFGYEECDSEIAQRSYDGFRKLIDDLQVMFPDGEYEEFTRLGSKT